MYAVRRVLLLCRMLVRELEKVRFSGGGLVARALCDPVSLDCTKSYNKNLFHARYSSADSWSELDCASADL